MYVGVTLLNICIVNNKFIKNAAVKRKWCHLLTFESKQLSMYGTFLNCNDVTQNCFMVALRSL